MVDLDLIVETFKAGFNTNGTLWPHDDGTLTVDGWVSVKPNTETFGLRFREVHGYFGSVDTKLRTMEGAPSVIHGDLSIRHCPHLAEFGHGLNVVQGLFRVEGTGLKSFVGGPKSVQLNIDCQNNPDLVSLEGFPTSVGSRVEITYTPTLPVLRLLVAPGIWFSVDTKDEYIDDGIAVENILMKYAGQGRAAAIDCKRELVAAGFEGNARW